MAQPSETIFNLGSSHISASKFSLQSGKLSLESFELIDLPIVSGGEQDWLDAVEGAINELASLPGFKCDASFILPSSIVLSKTLRVPKVESEKQRKVVAFELSQKMPFPLETLLWDFLVIEDDGIEQEILSFAIKPDVIEKLTQSIFSSGIVPVRFTPGPALDHCSLKESLKTQDSDSLLINFGAKSTNLTFFSSSGYLLRSLNFGGGHLTESIASSFGVNQEKAEDLKKNFTNEKRDADPTDNAVSMLHAIQENFLNKYMQEISRSIVTYKRLKKGKTPSQLIVTGRTIKSANLLQSLAQSQMKPIKYFDPFTQIIVSDTINESDRSILPFIFSESLGLANLLILEPKSTALNLIPTAKLKQLENKKKLPWLLASAFLMSLIPLPWYLTLSGTERKLNEEAVNLKRQTVEETEKLNLSKKENANLELIKSINKTAGSHINQLEILSKKVFSIQDFLNSLQLKLDEEINQNTWIDRFEFLPPRRQITAPLAKREEQNALSVLARVSGRYLVKPDIQLYDLPEDGRKLALIEESGRIQESLTKAVSDIGQVVNVSKKTFSIEGKGDLYNRQFTHFEFDLELDLLR